MSHPRRRIRFRIATMLLVTALCGVSISWWVEHSKRKRLEERVELLQKLHDSQANSLERQRIADGHRELERKLMLEAIGGHEKFLEFMKAEYPDRLLGP